MSDIRVKQEAVGTAPIPATYPGATGSMTLVDEREFGSKKMEAVLVEYEVAGGLGIVKSHVPLEDVKLLCIVDDTGNVESVIGTDNIRTRLNKGQTGYVCAGESAIADNEIRWPTKAQDLKNLDFELIRRLFEDSPPAELLDCRPPRPC